MYLVLASILLALTQGRSCRAIDRRLAPLGRPNNYRSGLQVPQGNFDNPERRIDIGPHCPVKLLG